jgi:hypothetical protein
MAISFKFAAQDHLELEENLAALFGFALWHLPHAKMPENCRS